MVMVRTEHRKKITLFLRDIKLYSSFRRFHRRLMCNNVFEMECGYTLRDGLEHWDETRPLKLPSPSGRRVAQSGNIRNSVVGQPWFKHLQISGPASHVWHIGTRARAPARSYDLCVTSGKKKIRTTFLALRVHPFGGPTGCILFFSVCYCCY